MKNLVICVLSLILLTKPLNIARGETFGLGTIQESLPEPYRAWVPWILVNNQNLRCPYNSFASSYQCVFYGTFTFNLTSSGGHFSGEVENFRDQIVLLPGSAKNWPTQVKVNQSIIPVSQFKDSPSVFLSRGKAKIEGDFAWNNLPNSLKLPPRLFHIKLMVNDIEIQNPKFGSENDLWLNDSNASLNSDQDALSLDVFRLYDDSIPALLTTRLVLKVSGKSREIYFGPFLPKGFLPLAIHSKLPSQWTAESNLKVRVQPGQHEIDVVSRSTDKLDRITLPRPLEASWPSKELWAVQTSSLHRDLEVNLVSIDPSQTNFPKDWHKSSLYLVETGATIELNPKEKAKTAAGQQDQLSLSRDMWLDGDGKGYSIKDRITGQIAHSFRLNVFPDYQLGKASINDAKILVTKFDDKTGIEVRDAHINVEAEGRLNPSAKDFSATGWQQSFDKLSVVLNLPPGWRLIGAVGVDTLSDSWLKRWNLLNIFILCLITLGISKLLGLGQGVLAFFTVLLLLPEPEAPRWIWLTLICLLGFHRALPATGAWRHGLTSLQLGFVLLFVILSVNFSVPHLRYAIHPILEPLTFIPQDILQKIAPTPTAADDGATPEADAGVQQESAAEAPTTQRNLAAAPMPPVASQLQPEAKNYGSPVKALSLPRLFSSSKSEIYSSQSAIQTGYGIPNRNWHQFLLNWEGPVNESHRFNVILSPPFVNGLLAFVRVFLVIVLGFFIIKNGFLDKTQIFIKRN